LAGPIEFPILSGDALLGFLCLQDERLREAYSTDEIALFLDVASQVTIVIENSKLYDRMKERDRLAALGEMSAGLAHEIRNPLGAIKGAAQYLETGGGSDAKEFLGVIVEEVNRLDEVVSQFLDYARPLKSASTLLDLNAVVKKAALVWEAQGIPPGIEIHFALAPDLPPVAADPQQMKQVFINFALNAFEAMPKGGRLDISTSVTPDPFMGEDHVRVSFKDTGQGIGAAEMKRLFIPFFTTKEKGTGLGLAICQRIAEANGGTIEVRSRKGKGAAFSLRLGAARAESSGDTGERRVAK
jgi:signal transduction histidine kinase